MKSQVCRVFNVSIATRVNEETRTTNDGHSSEENTDGTAFSCMEIIAAARVTGERT
jgi:hypothetical protein